MFRHKIVLSSVVCLFTAGWVGQTLCQTQSSDQRVSPSEFVRTKQLEAEQRRKEFEKRVAAENKERMAATESLTDAKQLFTHLDEPTRRQKALRKQLDRIDHKRSENGDSESVRNNARQ
jgi:hypothetical protein